MMTKTTDYRPKLIIAIVLSFVAFTYVAWLAHRGQMFPWEVSLFHSIYNLPSNWQLPALLVTQMGSTWLVIILTLLFYARHKNRLALEVLFVGLATFGVTEGVKILVHRPRPFELLTGVASREWSTSGYGFSSGHTAVATAVVVTLWPAVPKKWRWALITGVLLVAFTRVYLGVHAPLDIIGGALLGFTIGGALLLMNPRHLPHQAKKH